MLHFWANVTFLGQCYIFQWRRLHFSVVTLFSAACAAFCTSRGAFAHLWTTPLCWWARDIAVRKECHHWWRLHFSVVEITFFSGGNYIFYCWTDFDFLVMWSNEKKVKICPAIKNVISTTEKCNIHHYKSNIHIGRSKGRHERHIPPPLWGPTSFNFMQFLWKFGHWISLKIVTFAMVFNAWAKTMTQTQT